MAWPSTLPTLVKMVWHRNRQAALVPPIGQAGDWDRVLEIIRENEAQITKSQAAALRGIAWDRLGHPQVAALFFEEAARLLRLTQPGHEQGSAK
jgi:hypothetical protein